MLDSLIKADHSATDENGSTQLFASAQQDESPINFSIENLKPGHAGRRALVGSCHTPGIQKQNASAFFIASQSLSLSEVEQVEESKAKPATLNASPRTGSRNLRAGAS